MNRSLPSLERVGRTVAYLALGAIGTVATALVLLNVTGAVQPVVYSAVYPLIGPVEATQTAILIHFLAASAVGLALPVVLADYASTRLANRAPIARGIAAMLALVGLFLAASLAGLAAFLTAILVLSVALVGVPLFLYRRGVRSGALPTFVGGVPVVVLLLLAAGFGLGWGWGYVVTAQEVPASTVEGQAADFEDVPAVRDDLFAEGHCGTDADDRRTCHLELRGYDHERAAVRFLARHGVRCPYRGTAATADAFTARHDGTYYRVSCAPHGD